MLIDLVQDWPTDGVAAHHDDQYEDIGIDAMCDTLSTMVIAQDMRDGDDWCESSGGKAWVGFCSSMASGMCIAACG